MRRREEPQDSCVACHMPRYQASDIVHSAATDHTIVRHRGKAGADPHGPDGPPVDITLAELAVEAFYPADASTAAALRAMAD